MRCHYACGTADHVMARRQFLGTMAAGGSALVGGLSIFGTRQVSAALNKQQKRLLVFNMHGGLSQLESWDPKPGTATGGPFRAIPTNVTGIHISELLPETAKVMNHFALVRGVNTKEDDHGKGAYLMMTGRRQSPAADYPQIGAVLAKCVGDANNALPGHVVITPGGGGGRSNDSAYLGPKYASIALGNGSPPANMARPDGLTEVSDTSRQAMRRKLDEQFLNRRRTAKTDLYTYSYEAAQNLMAEGDAFDVSKESETDQARYGKHDLGRHCLLARRLLERGVSCVQVSHSNYDTHNENFIFHIEQVGEFDRPFATLVGDLADRGMLDSTLIVVLSEFGRTPGINHLYGRDHWSRAWSIAMAGCGVQRGSVFGKTNDNGTEVIDGEVDHGHLFHTYLRALGVDSSGSFDIDGRQLPLADPAAHAIEQVLV
jgi:uncharacterized protein (DUF1501 family)